MPRLVAFVAALLLAACAVRPVAQALPLPPREALAGFAIEGRFSLTQDHERHAGRLSWQHLAGTDSLQIASPFGQTVAEIVVVPGRAQLETSDRQRFEAADAAALTREVLGYALPVTALADWLLGRGAGDVAHDALGRPLSLRAGEWEVSYEYDSADAAALPDRLQVRREGGPDIRLRIEEWKVLP